MNVMGDFRSKESPFQNPNIASRAHLAGGFSLIFAIVRIIVVLSLIQEFVSKAHLAGGLSWIFYNLQN